MREVVRVVGVCVGELHVNRFVDDLRLVNQEELRVAECESLLGVHLQGLKGTLGEMGINVHTKVGKLIPPTRSIEWVGWLVDSK